MPVLTEAIEHIGSVALAAKAAVTLSAITKWKKTGRLPLSDLAGVTHYAQAIEELSRGRFPAAEILVETRKAWQGAPKRGKKPTVNS